MENIPEKIDEEEQQIYLAGVIDRKSGTIPIFSNRPPPYEGEKINLEDLDGECLLCIPSTYADYARGHIKQMMGRSTILGKDRKVGTFYSIDVHRVTLLEYAQLVNSLREKTNKPDDARNQVIEQQIIVEEKPAQNARRWLEEKDSMLKKIGEKRKRQNLVESRHLLPRFGKKLSQ